MLKFELHDYSSERAKPVITIINVKNEAAARGRAGRLAKREGGPVDLARAGRDRPEIHANWERRYVTTAAPSEFHKSGYRFERLDS